MPTTLKIDRRVSVSLLDRSNGLPSGGTYFPAPIGLFRPETGLKAYDGSIRRLAALAPHIRTVRGAHNVPVAPPLVLPRLVAAFEAVPAGKIAAAPASEGRVLYKVEDITFLMRTPEAKSAH